MRRLAALALALVVLGAVAIATSAAASREDGVYRVRAIFQNASFVITGEDVRVAGVVVGSIEAIELTPANTAAVVLRIDDPAFADFRADAHCRVRLQSLIGEQFVECVPTQPRGAEVDQPPALRRVASGPGREQHLLPAANTSSPVGVDLLADIQRLPQRERLRLIIAELGTGLAGNGDALRAAVRRADPALREADRFVATLAGQTHTLDRLVRRSDAVLRPLAASRRQLSGFVDGAGRTAQAAADRGPELQEGLRRLPAFLRELSGTTERLGALAGQADPALGALEARASDVNALVARLAPLSRAGTPALTSLGRFADRSRAALPQIAPVARDLRGLGAVLEPLATDLGGLATSFRDADGIESLLRFVYFYTGAINGQDGVSHYIRSALGVNQCADRLAERTPTCIGTFESADATTASASAAADGIDFLLGTDEEPAP